MLSLKQPYANSDLDRNPHRLDHRRADPGALGRRSFVLFGAAAERRRRFCRAVGRIQDVDLTKMLSAGNGAGRRGVRKSCRSCGVSKSMRCNPSRDGFELDQGVEAIVASVALPDVADFDT